MEQDDQNDPRGGDTRKALIAAGLEIFSRFGFEGASNRQLAATAGVNQALIGYHFGNKEGLYRAVIEALSIRMRQRLEPTVITLTAELAELKGTEKERQGALSAIETLLFQFLDYVVRDATKPMATLIAREQLEPSSAFDIVYEAIMGKVLSLLTKLIAQLDGETKPSNASRLTALLFVGQVLMFRVAHETTVRHMAWQDGLTDRNISTIQKQMRVMIKSRFAV